MAKRVKVKLNIGGVGQLLKSEEVQKMLREYGSATLNRVGDGYELEEGQTLHRAKCTVRAKSYKAKRDCLKNNTLLKALGGGAS